MMRSRRAAIVAVALLLSARGHVAAQSRVPPRDAVAGAVAPGPGTAMVSGVVTADESPSRPLRRATVSLISADLRVPLSTVTDDGGRFTFTGVPAGNYGIAASKPAYVGAFYGSKRPGRGPGVPVAVGDGQHVTGVSLSLLRGSAISGNLRLPSGLPALGMTVVVAEIEGVTGLRRLRLAGGRATTDDRGTYRVWGLPPGDYVVQAQPSGLLRGALTGVSDAPQTTPAEVNWAQEMARSAGSVGFGPGRSVSAPERGKTMNYATVYYPGTVDPAGASVVTVGPREDRWGIDFAMELVPTAKVSGVVVGPDGAPLAGASVSLVAADDGLSVVGLLAPRAAVRSNDDGSFAVPAVPPGRFRLVARASPGAAGASAPAAPMGVLPGVRTMAAAGGNRAVGAATALWAVQPLVVDGRDQPDVTLLMQPGMVVSGRVLFESSFSAGPAPDDLANARVTLVPVRTGGRTAEAIASGSLGATAAVAPDGTFRVTGIVPDAYRIRFMMPGLRTTPDAPGGAWSLRSVLLDGADVADRVLTIEPRTNLEGLVATFTDRPAELVGALTDQANRPAPGYPIVVFSTDRRHWAAGSRRVVVARPSTDGTFRLVGLPAGPYHLAAVVDLDPSDVEDASFLEQLVPGAVTVTLADGTTSVQNLRLAPTE